MGVVNRFEDDRGVIQDLFGGPVHVTYIQTAKDAVRGNHVHRETTQWTMVISGRLRIANGTARTVLGELEIMRHSPGDPHAWKAIEDSACLVFTRGPRGEDYESDTQRLDEPLLS